ncbi:MAG: prepilin-type N-terminal cleavage/methylation domain-containing protein [Porticoccus sp.]|nr:prepilin-type N-terminal cleavage/methylation domain-containing protein [Porticoccus sp.]MBQ0807667.1 prepilin-type N-terminal cleavage/methylation domain-containing protein [Porticoccus sp.]
MPKSKGFTLIEVMIVVAIVAIIIGLALPNYREYVLRSNRAVGKSALLEAVSRQEQYFLNNRSYTDLLTDLGYPATYFVSSEGDTLAAASGSIYQITITEPDSNIGETAYTLSAVPQGGQTDDTKCGSLGINEQAAKTVASASESATYCW